MAQSTIGVMLKRLFLKSDPVEDRGPDHPVAGEPPIARPGTPPLVMLVPGVAGVSIYQMRTFTDAHSAASFVEACNPYRVYKEGILAFWAMHQRPPADCDAECAVLVRTDPSSELVHAYAFADLETATSYVRFRIDETGEPLESFVIYWAASIRITANPTGEVRLDPSVPPRVPRARRPSPSAAQKVAAETVAPSEPRSTQGMPPDLTAESIASGRDREVARADVAQAEDSVAGSPPPAVSETHWSRKAAPRRVPARVKVHVLALGLLGYGGKEIESELRSMFPGDRVPTYGTIVRWLRRAGISRANLKKWETMSEHAMRILEGRLAELEDAPLAEVARVAALLEGMRRKQP